MDTKRILGMFNAPKEKRYKSFCVQAADTEEVWLMQDKADVPVLQQDSICVWPDKRLSACIGLTQSPSCWKCMIL